MDVTPRPPGSFGAAVGERNETGNYRQRVFVFTLDIYVIAVAIGARRVGSQRQRACLRVRALNPCNDV